MPELDFDIKNVIGTEFGIGRKLDNEQTFEIVPVDLKVQQVLYKSASATWGKMQNYEGGSQIYDPSGEAASTKYLHLPLNDEMVMIFRKLQQADNMRINNSDLLNTTKVFCYFAQFTDNSQRRLTALHRTNQFKSLGKSRVVSWINGVLQLVENPIFKLDTDFDLLIDSKFVHILHPKSFEFAGNLEQFILNSVEKNAEIIQNYFPFVSIDPIKKYAATHPRAARYLASIRANWAKNTNKDSLKQLCDDNNVKIRELNGQFSISDAEIIGFLEVLDRRRYNIKLVTNDPERFRAVSRQKINS